MLKLRIMKAPQFSIPLCIYHIKAQIASIDHDLDLAKMSQLGARTATITAAEGEILSSSGRSLIAQHKTLAFPTGHCHHSKLIHKHIKGLTINSMKHSRTEQGIQPDQKKVTSTKPSTKRTTNTYQYN